MTVLERLTALEARKLVNLLHGPAKPKAKRSKYRNIKTTTDDGVKHDSKKEGMRWVRLRQDERDGLIRKLRRQVTYKLDVKGHKICRYIADFVYERLESDFCGVNVDLWTEVVEDVKSVITRKKRDYRIKVKLMKALHNIDVVEVL